MPGMTGQRESIVPRPGQEAEDVGQDLVAIVGDAPGPVADVPPDHAVPADPAAEVVTGHETTSPGQSRGMTVAVDPNPDLVLVMTVKISAEVAVAKSPATRTVPTANSAANRREDALMVMSSGSGEGTRVGKSLRIKSARGPKGFTYRWQQRTITGICCVLYCMGSPCIQST